MFADAKHFFGSLAYRRDPLAQEIEAVTNSTFSQLDQAACLEICDHISRRKDGPPIAMSVLVYQLEKSAVKNPKAAVFTMSLLDMCVKNCGYRFTSELCKGDYLKRLQKLIGRGKSADAIQTELLILIKTWMLAFSDYEEFRPISDLYRELLNSGVQFPDIKENDVDLLKRTLQLCRTSKVSGLAQGPTASNARTAQLMKAIRHDLDQAALDLPAFEAQVQGLARTQPDDVTLRQLHATADRLEGLQGRLKSYLGPLSDSMDPKLGSTEEKENALDELMRVNEKINANVQKFQSFARIRRGQEEETPGRKLGATRRRRSAATTAVATPPGARNLLPTGATTAAAPATTMYTADATEVSRMIIQTTLSQAKESIQLFKALQGSLKTSPAQANGVAQTRELRTVGERLEELQKEVHGLINEKLNEISENFTEEDEKVLANLTKVNDKLLLCVENCRRTLWEYESGLALRPEQSTVQDPATGTGAVPTWGQSVSTGLHSDPVPEIKTALDSTAVTGHMPANSQFVSQGPQFKTEPGPGTGYEKTNVVPPTSADSQLKRQSRTDHFPGSTTAFGTETVTGDMPANSQFVSQGPQFGTEPGLLTGYEKTTVVPPTSADSQVKSQDANVSQEGVCNAATDGQEILHDGSSGLLQFG